jgi:hypothetical protein
LIQHYVIKLFSDLRQAMVSSTNKTDRHDITKILLKVSLNTIKQQLTTRFNNIDVCLLKCEGIKSPYICTCTWQVVVNNVS